MDIRDMRQLAEEMIIEGVRSADSEQLVKKNIEVRGQDIKICGKRFRRDDYKEIVLLGIGKASVPMSRGCEELNPDDGLVITKHGDDMERDGSPVVVRRAHHPYPDQINIDASKELLSKVEEKEEALFIFLVSGGGSALFTYPVNGIKTSEIRELNEHLIKSGANINEINAVRKHLSRVKGGKFGDLCSKKGDIVSLIISDVVGDDLSSIASGPTYPDGSTYEDAKKILEEYGIWKRASQSIRDRIKRGLKGEVEETPTDLDVNNFLIGNNMVALKGARKIADKKELNTMILTSQNQGEAKEVAKPLIGVAKEVQDTGNPIEPPVAVLSGGETTVRLKKVDERTGEGGPNREFVLSAAIEIQDREDIVVASVDSDGIDGTDKAGAIADTSTVEKCTLDPKDHLEKHDTQTYFESIGDSIEFNSKTNVNDITVIIVGKKEQ